MHIILKDFEVPKSVFFISFFEFQVPPPRRNIYMKPFWVLLLIMGSGIMFRLSICKLLLHRNKMTLSEKKRFNSISSDFPQNWTAINAIKTKIIAFSYKEGNLPSGIVNKNQVLMTIIIFLFAEKLITYFEMTYWMWQFLYKQARNVASSDETVIYQKYERVEGEKDSWLYKIIRTKRDKKTHLHNISKHVGLKRKYIYKSNNRHRFFIAVIHKKFFVYLWTEFLQLNFATSNLMR